MYFPDCRRCGRTPENPHQHQSDLCGPFGCAQPQWAKRDRFSGYETVGKRVSSAAQIRSPLKGKKLCDPNGEMLFRLQQSLMMLADTAEAQRCIPAFSDASHRSHSNRLLSKTGPTDDLQRCCCYSNVDPEDSYRWMQRRRD